MGQELECRMHYQQRTLAGKAYLETGFVLFRGEERLKILFKDLKSVTAGEGVLTLDFPGGPAALELGKAAAKWRDKILHPPSRLDKLGVKPGLSLRLTGEFPPDFHQELRTRDITQLEGTKKVDVLFFGTGQSAELRKLAALTHQIVSDGAIWVVYPKGVSAIREIDVLESGRAAGFKDVKVASFSPTHTALKFVIPVDKR